MPIHTNLLKMICKQKFIFFLPATGEDEVLRFFLNKEDQKPQRHHQPYNQVGAEVGGVRQVFFICAEWLSLSLKHFLIPQSKV